MVVGRDTVENRVLVEEKVAENTARRLCPRSKETQKRISLKNARNSGIIGSILILQVTAGRKVNPLPREVMSSRASKTFHMQC